MTTAIAEVTLATAAKVLRSLLQGRTRIFIAGDCHITRQTVDDIADFYGFATEPDVAVVDARLAQLDAEVRAGRGQALVDFTLVHEDDQRPRAGRACRGCGCTDDAACPGGCWWVEPDLCSSCLPAKPDTHTAIADALVLEAAAPPPAAGGGAHPYITALPASLLFVDPTYQRPRDDGRVRRMVANFDVTQLGVLEVSARADGRYAIVEGQHRWHAAREAAPAPVILVCKVHRGLDVAGEAALFYQIDRGRKPLNHWDRYKSRRAAGEQLVVEIERTCAHHGYVVDPAPKDGNIAATGALEKIVELGDATLLDRTLAVVHAAYGKARDGVTAELLTGVALVLANYDPDVELDQARLVEALQDIAPRQVRARAVALREANRAELPRLAAAVIIDRYNARPGAKLEPLLGRLPATSRLFGHQGRKTCELARIRRWAARNQLPLNSDGTIPKATLDGYTAAAAAGMTPR